MMVRRLPPTMVLALAALYSLFPVVWLLIASTKDTGDLYGTSPFAITPDALPQFITNVERLFARDDGIYLRWLGNTLLYAAGGALGATLIAGLAGYALAWFPFRGRSTVFSVILGGVMVPPAVLAVPLFLMFGKVGAANTVWAVLLPSLVSPMGVYLARTFAESAVPADLLEAARLDGAGEVGIFFRIVVRLMSPGLTTVFLFQLVTIWNNYLLPLIMLKDSDLFPVTMGLATWQAGILQDSSLNVLVIIGSLVSTVPLIVVFASLQRFWRADLAAGSVK